MVKTSIRIEQQGDAVTVKIHRYGTTGTYGGETELAADHPVAVAILQAVDGLLMPKSNGGNGNGKLAISRIEIDNQHWEPVKAPKACNVYVLTNPASVLPRTDPEDANTEKQEAANMNPPLTVPWTGPGCRFEEGETIMWLRSVEGSQTITGVFVR